MKKPVFAGAILACLSCLLGAQWGMGPGPGTAHAVALNPCLVSAWPMNEGSGLTLNDSSGNSNTITGAANFRWSTFTGFPGTIDFWEKNTFNGKGNVFAQATSTTVTNFSGSTAFSASAWVALSDSRSQAFLSTLHAGGSNFQGWEISVDYTSPDRLTFYLINSVPGNTFINLNGSTNIGDGVIHYVVATYDGSGVAAGVKLYVDGALETMTTDKDTFTSTAANGIPVVAGQRTDGTSPLSGPMAFAEVYNCVLTPTQIATYHTSGPGIY